MRSMIFLLGVLFLFQFTHCTGVGNLEGGSEAGNPAPVTVDVVGYSSSESKQVKLLTLPANNITVDLAQINIQRFRFRPFSFCQGESESNGEIRFEGNFVVDLLDMEFSPELAGVTIPRDTYCKIEIRLAPLDESVDPGNPISGKSVLITGSRSDGIPFMVQLEEDEEFELENEITGFVIDPSLSLNSFFIAFDLDLWFAGVNLSDPSIEISQDPQGHQVIFIDEVHNTDIRNIIIENLETSGDLFEDKNDNGELDVEEQEDSLAEGKTI